MAPKDFRVAPGRVRVCLFVALSAVACTDDGRAAPGGDGGPRTLGDARAREHDAAGPAREPDGSSASRPLWNGVDLSEWDGDPKIWKAVSGAIVGNAAAGSAKQTTYLILKGRSYGDFVLTGEIRVGTGGNSGIVYRSAVTNATTWVVKGYQEDAADTYWGTLYVDGRGTVAQSLAACTKGVRPNDYNSFEIRAVGASLTHRLNGVDCVVYTEKTAGAPTSGLFAIQYHMGGGWEVSVRNLSIREP
jgi:3-keto-disaccharide hydrolase